MDYNSTRSFTIFQLLFRRIIQIRAELCKDFHLSELRQINTDTSGCLLHSLSLCCTTYTGY